MMNLTGRLQVFLVFNYMAIIMVHGLGELGNLPLNQNDKDGAPVEPFCIPRNKSTAPSNKEKLPLCALPVEELVRGRALPGSYIQPTPLPPWLNAPLARKGQAFATKNTFSMAISALTGLMAGLPFPEAREVLSFTGLSGTGPRASKRYVATGIQMFIWLNQLLKSNLSDENNVFLTSVTNVRAIHLNVARRSNTAHKPINNPNKYDNVSTDEVMWAALQKDLMESNLTVRDYSKEYYAHDSNATYVSQFAQGITLVGIAGYALMDPEGMFIWDATDDEFMGYLHIWAVVGYVIGVQDDYNVCLQPNVQTAREYFVEVIKQYAIPGFFQIDHIGKVLVEALLRGANEYVPGIGIRPILYRLLRDNFKIPAGHLEAILTSADIAAQSHWDNVFKPSTRLPLTRLALNKAVEDGLNIFGLAMFGPFEASDAKAEHCFMNEENADKSFMSAEALANARLSKGLPNVQNPSAAAAGSIPMSDKTLKGDGVGQINGENTPAVAKGGGMPTVPKAGGLESPAGSEPTQTLGATDGSGGAEPSGQAPAAPVGNLQNPGKTKTPLSSDNGVFKDLLRSLGFGYLNEILDELGD